MIPAPVTALFAGINAIFNIALAAMVSAQRGKDKVFIGTGQSERLLLASRRHANNVEYVPLAIVMMLVVELCGGSSAVLYGVGGALTLGRLMHAYAVDTTPSPLRAVGAVLTWLAIVAAGGYALFLGVSGR
jgi:hypothetical protein